MLLSHSPLPRKLTAVASGPTFQTANKMTSRRRVVAGPVSVKKQLYATKILLFTCFSRRRPVRCCRWTWSWSSSRPIGTATAQSLNRCEFLTLITKFGFVNLWQLFNAKRRTKNWNCYGDLNIGPPKSGFIWILYNLASEMWMVRVTGSGGIHLNSIQQMKHSFSSLIVESMMLSYL